MADTKLSKPKGSTTPHAFDAAKAKGKSVDGSHAYAATPPPAEHGGHRSRLLRRAWCGLAIAGALAAVVMLVLSLTVLRVRDPALSMESVTVDWFNVHFDPTAARPLRINVTLVGRIAIRNPNYASLRFGASNTEIYIDGVPGYVGVGRAPPGEVAARATSRVTEELDVFVDRVGMAAAAGLLFGGGGEVRLTSRTAVDGRVSVLGGLYGKRSVRVAMRCHVALRVSAAAVVAGSPACVADFGR